MLDATGSPIASPNKQRFNRAKAEFPNYFATKSPAVNARAEVSSPLGQKKRLTQMALSELK